VTVVDRTPVPTQDFRFVPPTGIIRVERAPAEVSGRFSGVVRDGWDRPLPLITILLTESQTKARFVTCTDGAGAFEFANLPGGTFALEAHAAVRTGYYGRQIVMRSPDIGGYEIATGTFELREREILHSEIRVRMRAPLDSSWQTRPDLYARPVRLNFPGGLAGGGSLRGVEEPALDFPADFKGSKVDASVAIQLLIGLDGTLIWLHVVSPDADPDLARAALQELLKWPAFPPIVSVNGGPRTTLGTLNVYFTAGNED
jgi:hypothetical protein